MKRLRFIAVATLTMSSFAPGAVLAAPDVESLQLLGKYVFFDKISQPPRQACVSCHVPANGWTGGVAGINKKGVAIPGADPHTVGGRRPPSNAYGSFSPEFGSVEDGDGENCQPSNSGIECEGGVFWDGRAEGKQDPMFEEGASPHVGKEVYGGDNSLARAYGKFIGPMADQALAPFSNDVEQNNPDGNDNGLPGAEAVCRHVASQPYVPLYVYAWGEEPNCESSADLSFKRIALAISAWQHSKEVNSFSSKFDRALANDDDDTPGKFPLEGFTAQENLGHDLFYGVTSDLNPEGKDARCAACHNNKGSNSDGTERDQLYTDLSYHHIGLPPNYEIANFDPNDADDGLSEHTNPSNPAAGGHAGHFKTPTLRNVDKRRSRGFTKAYMHNGYFKNLADVVHFYNTATAKLDPAACPPGITAAQARARDCWPAAEVNNGLQASNFGVLGDLGLTELEEEAIVAYMKTLSDTETPKAPQPYRPSSR